MKINANRDAIKIDLNRDELGNPISILMTSEQHMVADGYITLSQIPDKNYRVKINGFVEIPFNNGDVTQDNMFRVDYANGLIYFHGNQEGKTIVVNEYYGRGICLTPASRVYLHTTIHDDIENTLQDVIDEAERGLRIVHEIADIDGYVEEGKILRTDLGQQIADGGVLKQGLIDNIATGNVLKTNLDDRISQGTTLKGNLETIISTGTTDIDNLITTGKNDLTTLTINHKNDLANTTNTFKDEIGALSDIEQGEISTLADTKLVEVESALVEIDDTLNIQYKTIDGGDFGDELIFNTYDGGEFTDITTPIKQLNGGDFMTGAVEYQARSNQYMYMMSPNGVKFKLTIDDSGNITTSIL